MRKSNYVLFQPKSCNITNHVILLFYYHVKSCITKESLVYYRLNMVQIFSAKTWLSHFPRQCEVCVELLAANVCKYVTIDLQSIFYMSNKMD